MKVERKNKLVEGLILVGIGLLFLFGQLTNIDNFGMVILPALAVIFTLWAIVTQTAGLFIPAGVFTGISLGIGLMESPLGNLVADDGGLFLLGFAGGWVFMTIMTAIFSRETYWWALIPAGIMGFIGTAIITEGILLQTLSYSNIIWPLALIGLGIYLVLRRPEKEKDSAFK